MCIVYGVNLLLKSGVISIFLSNYLIIMVIIMVISRCVWAQLVGNTVYSFCFILICRKIIQRPLCSAYAQMGLDEAQFHLSASLLGKYAQVLPLQGGSLPCYRVSALMWENEKLSTKIRLLKHNTITIPKTHCSLSF